jgi:hypothetical protein
MFQSSDQRQGGMRERKSPAGVAYLRLLEARPPHARRVAAAAEAVAVAVVVPPPRAPVLRHHAGITTVCERTSPTRSPLGRPQPAIAPGHARSRLYTPAGSSATSLIVLRRLVRQLNCGANTTRPVLSLPAARFAQHERFLSPCCRALFPLASTMPLSARLISPHRPRRSALRFARRHPWQLARRAPAPRRAPLHKHSQLDRSLATNPEPDVQLCDSTAPRCTLTACWLAKTRRQQQRPRSSIHLGTPPSAAGSCLRGYATAPRRVVR